MVFSTSNTLIDWLRAVRLPGILCLQKPGLISPSGREPRVLRLPAVGQVDKV